MICVLWLLTGLCVQFTGFDWLQSSHHCCEPGHRQQSCSCPSVIMNFSQNRACIDLLRPVYTCPHSSDTMAGSDTLQLQSPEFHMHMQAHSSFCHAGESSQAGSAGDEDEGWTRQGRGKKSQAVTRGKASVQACPLDRAAGNMLGSFSCQAAIASTSRSQQPSSTWLCASHCMGCMLAFVTASAGANLRLPQPSKLPAYS